MKELRKRRRPEERREVKEGGETPHWQYTGKGERISVEEGVLLYLFTNMHVLYVCSCGLIYTAMSCVCVCVCVCFCTCFS